MSNNNRFAHLRAVANPNTPASTPVNTPAPAAPAQIPLLNTPPPASSEPVVGKTIMPKAQAKANADQALVRRAFGLAVEESEQFFVNGTKMMTVGENTLKSFRQDFEKMPMFADILEKGIATIEAEKRVDYTAHMSGVSLDSNGLIQGVNGGNLVPTGHALQNLASFGPEDIDASLRYNVNLWASASGRKLNFRTRNPKGDIRSLYAVTGERYSKFDLDDVCKALEGKMPAGCKGQLQYNGSRWSISAELAPTFKADEMGVGVVHRVRCIVTGADDRSKGLVAKYQAVRVRCINCTTITDERVTFKRKHIGDVAELFEFAVAHAKDAMEIFAKAWAEANTRAIVNKADGGKLSPEEIFKRLIAHGYVDVPGYTGKTKSPELLNMLMASFNKEPLESAAGINMAITRLAHEGLSAWKSPWAVEAIEQSAGELLFQKVHKLPELTDAQAEVFAA